MEQTPHPEFGNCPVFPVPIRFSETRCRFGETPAIGEHNEYALKEVLGMSDEEIAALVIEGVIE